MIQRIILFSGLLFALMPNAWAAEVDEDAPESWNAKFQTTFNWQKHPEFSARYSGANSLVTRAEEMYTFSASAFLGVRPWAGGEVYLTPELTSGVPFSTNLVGLGGFTNGEITRAGGREITLYRQKIFLRQTWNNGGGTEIVGSSANQLAGVVDKNRFVLTLGNFSTLDVFDPNLYAKDARTQFMNWSNWTYAAYDYAADARGFGWGFAAEWYQNEWVLRFGRMTGPQDPNGLSIDFALDKHYGDQLEIEHSHELLGQAGKLRVLGWHNRALLATFNDALAWLKAHPGQYAGPEALLATRYTEQDKYGLGVNLEQVITPDVGFFLRAMKADGRTETHAFTEVDGSFSSGLTMNGRRWGREKDSVGFSFSQNTLSPDRQRFLEAGGTSFFIGDGSLRYQPETIFEAYYSLKLKERTWLTPDYQYVANPAYNADRGPVHVMALRLHGEF